MLGQERKSQASEYCCDESTQIADHSAGERSFFAAHDDRTAVFESSD